MNTNLKSNLQNCLQSLLVFLTLAIALGARADSLVWDANGTTAGGGGNGNWTGGNTWSNATALTTFAPWVDGNAAVIPATSTITNNSSIVVTAITNTGGNPAQIVGTGVNALDFGAGGYFVSPGNTTTLRTSSKLKGVVTLVPTSGTLAQAIALWVKADNTNLTSLTLAPTVPLGAMIADDAGAFGPAATSSLLITNRGIVTLGMQASELVGPLPGISNPNGISYNAVPTTIGSGYIRSRFGTNTWNGPITLTANDSGFITRGSSTVMLKLASTATIDLGSYTLQLNVDSASAGLFLNGSISGSGGLTTVGTGTIANGANGTGVTTLGASNSFSGVALTAQNLGTIALNHTNALYAATLDTGASGSQQVTFVIAGNNTYNLGALTGSDALAMGGNTLSVGAKAVDTTFSAIISGSGGGLRKVGGNILTLDAANTYDGLTTISGGTLALGASGSLAAGSSVSIASGTVFDVSAPGTYTHGASASLTAGGTAITPAVIFGGTTVDLGSRPVTLNFTPDAFTGDADSPALNISQGALTISGAITVVNNGASPLDAGSYVLISQASGTITGTPTLSGTVGGLGLVGGNSAIITNTGTTINLVVQGALPTTTTVTRAAGTGTTTTYGDTLSFDVSVSPALATGTVELRDGGPSGTLLGSGTLVGGTNTITPADNALTAGSHPNIVALYLGDVNYQASASTALSTQTVTNKPLTVSGAVADSKYYDSTPAATLSGGTLNGVESGDTVTLNQTGTFASAGPGTGIAVTSTSSLGGAAAPNYILTQPAGLSADIYATAIWTGTAGDTFWNTSLNWLTNVVPNGSGVIADFTQLDISTAQTVNLNAARTVGHLTFSDTDTNTPAGWTLANNGSAANTLTLAGTGPSITVSDLGANKVTISAVVAGSAGLTKAGAGTLALTGANTYSGGTIISNGTVTFTSDGALGATPGVATPGNITLNTGTLSSAGNNLTLTTTRGTAVGAGGGTIAIAAPGAGNLTYGGVIEGPGMLTLNPAVANSGILLQSPNNSYSGGTLIIGAASANVFVLVNSTGSPGSPTNGPFGTGTVTFNGPGTRSTTGADTTLGNAITFAADTAFPTVANEKSLTLSGPVTLTSNRTLNVSVGTTVAGKSLTIAGSIGDGGNAYALTKTGGGRLELAGNNTYSGGTALNAGFLTVASAGALGTSGTINFGGGALQFSGANTTDYTGRFSTASNQLYRFDVPTNLSVTLGAVPLTSVGGTLTLSGGGILSVTNNANTFSGNVTLNANAGLLRITTIGALGVGPKTFQTTGGGAMLELDGSAGNISLASNISFLISAINGAVTNSAGNNTISGNFSMTSGNGGTRIISEGGSLTLAGGIVPVSSAGADRTLELSGSSTGANAVTGVIGDGGGFRGFVLKTGTGTWTLNNANTYTGNTTVSNGVLVLGSLGSIASSGTVQVDAAGTLDATTPGFIVNISKTLTGSGIVLGNTTVASGGRIVPGSGGLGTLTNTTLVLSSGSTADFEITDNITLDHVNVTASGGLTLNGGGINLYQPGTALAFTMNGTYSLFQYSGSLNGSVANLYVANAQPGKTYTFSATGSTVDVTIADGPAPIYWGVDADGSWTNATDWSPNTVPNAQYDSANFGGAGSPGFSGPHTVTLDGNKLVGALVFDSAQSFTLNQGGGGTLQFDNGGALASIAQISGSHTVNLPVSLSALGGGVNVATATTLALNGAIGGTGGLIKSGTGTLLASGANTYSGATTVSAGNLVVSNNAALGATTGATLANGGWVELAHGIVVTGETITVNGFGSNVRGALQSGQAATNEWAGPVILGAGSADSRVGAQADGTLILSGVISGGTINNLIVSADHISGKVIVAGTANTYTGESQIIRGTLELGAHNALPVGTVLNVDAGSSVGDNGAFEMNGFNQQVAGIRRPNTGGDYSVKNSSGTQATLTVNNTNNYTFPNTLTGATVIEGNLTLAKSGSGTLTLNSANTYTGNTTISAGKLALSGAGTISGTPLITVNTNASFDVTGIGFILGETQTLAGSGTVLGDVTANGIIIPGSSIGTLTFSNNLTINSNLVFELNKSHPQSNDVIAVVGTLNNTGIGTLTVTNLGPALVVNDSFKLFSQAVVGGLGLTIAGPAGVTFTNNLEVDGSIAVLTVPGGGPVIPSTPTNITFTASGGNLTIGWPSNYVGWILQSQTNLRSVGLKTNWFNVAGSDATNTMTFPVNKTDPTVFFRLARTNQP